MSGIGFWELIILFLIGLVVLGPERLPRVAQQLGNWVGQARRMTRMMRRQLEDELHFDRNFNIQPGPSKESIKPTPDTAAPGNAGNDDAEPKPGQGSQQ
jgi:sec-independent protein translocase protein TatB